MRRLINKYLGKLEVQGLATKDDALFLALDADLFSNKPLSGDVLVLKEVCERMNIGSLLFAKPAEPYRSVIREITAYDRNCLDLKKIVPMDCETRTFFHDIPVIDEFSAHAIADALSHRKSAIIKGRGIVAYGVVTPEQAFVSFSSTCFSSFVKYFYDSLVYFDSCVQKGVPVKEEYLKAFRAIAEMVGYVQALKPRRVLRTEAPVKADEVIEMLAEAGREVVESQLVDSYFGNISYVHDGHIFISQTGSSLDELDGCIDRVPLDGSSSVGITASSELSAHKNIYFGTGCNAILHGHPKFSVIMSMYCKKEGCDRSLCHKACREKRDILQTPVVPGEIGTGPMGLMNTVPPAMKHSGGTIVYGHGVFTAGNDDFQGPFDMLTEIEDKCRREYFRTVELLLKHLFKGDSDCLAERA
jgi:ribulose-5-phosphate 4-epimerase/fuculose-1-phosphate aldolase